MDDVDLPELARLAGVPADDPAVIAFAQLVAARCAEICEAAEPMGDAAHVPREHFRAAGAELGVQIRAVFQCEEAPK